MSQLSHCFQGVIYEICEIALGKTRQNARNNKKIGELVDKTFTFLQEHCNENDYLKEEFLKEPIELREPVLKDECREFI